MDQNEIVRLLKHKRHDWMNQVQLIQSYATLGKQDSLSDYLEQLKEEAEEERKLLNSGADRFSLWLLTFNWKEEQFRVQYQLESGLDLSRHDQKLNAYHERMIEFLKEFCRNDELYEGKAHFYRGKSETTVCVSWEWEGPFVSEDELIIKLEQEGFIASVVADGELSVEMTIE